MPQVLNLDELHEMKRESAFVECSCRDRELCQHQHLEEI